MPKKAQSSRYVQKTALFPVAIPRSDVVLPQQASPGVLPFSSLNRTPCPQCTEQIDKGLDCCAVCGYSLTFNYLLFLTLYTLAAYAHKTSLIFPHPQSRAGLQSFHHSDAAPAAVLASQPTALPHAVEPSLPTATHNGGAGGAEGVWGALEV